MKIKKFIQLCSLSKKILLSYKDSKNILAIRQFYLMRPHSVLLKEYCTNKKKNYLTFDNKKFLNRIFYLIKDFLFETKKFYTFNSLKKKLYKKYRLSFFNTFN